jgi:methylenetetrahydrofolate dehydrogenase (NADP+)/methenyltetrahydrofolate cyclohydrolase/formyltetrahydrofolate synthetase
MINIFTFLFIYRSASQSEILQAIDKLNADPNVHGIIVQMPLDCDDKTIDSHLVTNRVESGKFFDIRF